jgi:hypothetical protein
MEVLSTFVQCLVKDILCQITVVGSELGYIRIVNTGHITASC